MAKKTAAGAKSGTAVLEQPTIDRAPLPREFKSIPIAAIAGSRDLNTRAAISDESVKELAESLRAQGLLQPIVVGEQTKDGSYQVLAGRRRLAAATLLGWERIHACVLKGGVARALEILVTENAQRVGPDPLLEAHVVAHLLQQPNWGLREAAAALGHSESWVARRAAIARLSKDAVKAIRAKREEDERAWPASWLEELALAPATEQAGIVRVTPHNFRRLRDEVRQAMRSLSTAPWPLDDAELTKAGPCTTCTKHSAAAPSLFPEETKLHTLKSALCRDAECFTKKLATWTKSRVAELKEEGKGDLQLVHGVRSHEAGYVEEEELGKGVKVAPTWDVSPAKKSDKGAKPALIVDGPKAGTLTYVRPAGSNSTSTRGSKAKNADAHVAVTPLAERRKQLALRRQRHVVNAFSAELAEVSKVPAKRAELAEDADVVLRLVAAFGTSHKGGWGHRESAITREKDAAGGMGAVRARVVEDLLESMLDRLGCFGEYAANGERAKRAYSDVEVFLDIVGWKGERAIAARLAAAETEIPEPKSWTAEKAETKSKKGAQRKGGK